MGDTVLYDVVIVGAGASGLMCALQCARRGKRVLLLEKSDRPARKILVSGNGRCNLTNAFVSAADYRGEPKLAAAVLHKFSFQNCLDLFHELGVLTVQEGAGRVFARSGKATAVAEALRLACAEAGAEMRLGCEVVKAEKKGEFILTLQDGSRVRGRRCVLACGSCAYPQAGGSDAGYKLAKSLGHHLVPVTPALCALNVKEKAVSRLQGVRVQARLTAVLPGNAEPVRSEGELLFTAYGLSGPAALNVSGPVGRALAAGPVRAEINLFPEVQDPASYLRTRVARYGGRTAKDFFAGMLHENISNLLIDFAGIKKNAPVSSWTENTFGTVLKTLTAWPFTVTSLRPWTEAMAAAGGVNCAEINYNTLESLRCPGLYVLGELLNVDGRSGGFNLHFAWGCACAAAAAMAEE